MNQLRVLWDLCVRVGRFTIYVGLGETRMKPADQQLRCSETNPSLFSGGPDSQIPRRRNRGPSALRRLAQLLLRPLRALVWLISQVLIVLREVVTGR